MISLTTSYYVHAEKKLGKLEGSNKKLTSRDVIASLSEAREDHMRQLISDPGITRPQDHSAGLYDPWKPHNSSTTSTTPTDMPQFELEDPLEGHAEIHQRSPWGWKQLCCLCCSTRQVAYSRTGQGTTIAEQPLTSLTPEEESAFLLDCDELGLTWEKDGENR